MISAATNDPAPIGTSRISGLVSKPTRKSSGLLSAKSVDGSEVSAVAALSKGICICIAAPRAKGRDDPSSCVAGCTTKAEMVSRDRRATIMLRVLPGGPECVRRDVRLRRRERERRTTRDRIGDQSQAGGGTREVICTLSYSPHEGSRHSNGTRAPRVHGCPNRISPTPLSQSVVKPAATAHVPPSWEGPQRRRRGNPV